jgi:cytochrome c-type biogenesis protein CcmH/NrfG
MRDTANAMNDLAKLINLKPSHHEAYDIRAKIFFAQQQWDKVIADINKKIAINPNDPVDWLIIGISYFNSGKKEEARSAFENSSKLGNENATLYLQRYFPQS